VNVQIKLIILSLDYKDNSVFILSDEEGEAKLPSTTLKEGDLDRQIKRLFKEYCNLSWGFISCELTDVKQKKDILEVYYGIIVPNDIIMDKGYKYIVGPAEGEELRTLVSGVANTL